MLCVAVKVAVEALSGAGAGGVGALEVRVRVVRRPGEGGRDGRRGARPLCVRDPVCRRLVVVV